MKILILNPVEVKLEILNVADTLIGEDAEEFLWNNDFDTNNISWMQVPGEDLTTAIHDFTLGEQGKIMHTKRQLKPDCVGEMLQELKRYERSLLKQVIRLYGKKTESGYKYEFDVTTSNAPSIVAYDRALQVWHHNVISIEIDNNDNLIINGVIADEDADDEVHELDLDDIFVGQLEYIIDCIKNENK